MGGVATERGNSVAIESSNIEICLIVYSFRQRPPPGDTRVSASYVAISGVQTEWHLSCPISIHIWEKFKVILFWVLEQQIATKNINCILKYFRDDLSIPL